MAVDIEDFGENSTNVFVCVLSKFDTFCNVTSADWRAIRVKAEEDKGRDKGPLASLLPDAMSRTTEEVATACLQQ
jgi:hypothetical protein